MDVDRPHVAYDRVVERRRAVALARHFREAEGLSIAQIADRLGRSPATIKAYFYDPTGEKARAVKARYVGVCRGCGAYTQPRNGKGDAYRYCKRCHPGAIERKWTRELRARGDAASGATATGGCRPRTTGRGRTRGGAGERHSSGWPADDGLRRVSSVAGSARGRPLGRRRSTVWQRSPASLRAWLFDWAQRPVLCLIQLNPPQTPMVPEEVRSHSYRDLQGFSEIDPMFARYSGR